MTRAREAIPLWVLPFDYAKNAPLRSLQYNFVPLLIYFVKAVGSK